MQTYSLLNQPRAREVGLALWRSWTHEAPTCVRRPRFDGLMIGLHWATAALVLALLIGP
jgi:hypothetical protein